VMFKKIVIKKIGIKEKKCVKRKYVLGKEIRDENITIRQGLQNVIVLKPHV